MIITYSNNVSALITDHKDGIVKYELDELYNLQFERDDEGILKDRENCLPGHSFFRLVRFDDNVAFLWAPFPITNKVAEDTINEEL